jgi:hypothetical protein
VLLFELLGLLGQSRQVFSQQRVFMRVCRQALGVLCTLGRRTVARVLAATGRDQRDWSAEYRLFSRSPWESEKLFLPVLKETLTHFPGPGPITLAGDFTHLQKTGKHIPQVTCMRDPMSPHFHVNLIYGLRFFQVSALCSFRERKPEPLPARSVPVRFEASPVTKKPGKRATEQERAAYKKALKARLPSKAARLTLEKLRTDFDAAGAAGRRLLTTLDGGFCNKVFFGQAFDRADLICRCRKDAVLCFQAQAKGGRRFYDAHTFTPENVRQDPSKAWHEDTFFHGGGLHPIRYKEINRVLWRGGGGRRFLRLLVLAPTGYRLHHQGRLLYRQPAYLLTDDLETPAFELISAYLEHWQIEVNHREEKSTLGLGNAQVRNERSVPRQPAFVVAIYSMLLLAALRAYGPERTEDYLPPPKWARPSKRPSCLDMLALLRHQLALNPQSVAKYGIQTSAIDLLVKAAA